MMGEKDAKKEYSNKHMYVHGFIRSQAYKIATFIFNDYLIQLKENHENRIFELYVDSRINDDELIKDVENHFKCFDIKKVTIEDEDSGESEE